ncbi:LLM class flavin-dependent oxidoreductase [Bacillus sp. FSL W8-1127]|uniref:LLM class flavin-dependent oxidoreductase n=1 Tax=Bacillus sp. FSL W8-1127 TaxID=2954710 RepID=UPI0030FBCB68
MALKLSVLDQSPISEGMTAEEALSNTVKLAQHVEKLGYERFWVSEHHDSTTLAGSSPEVLISYLAAKTKKIRLGSGGVMLTHYSPFKVAENFRVLEALNPKRIDLGIGRAPGGMPRATLALNNGQYRKVDRYSEQIDELLTYLYDSLDESHPYYGLKASPVTQTVPEVWMLGSSLSSAELAAQKGLPYTFAQFINGEGGPEFTKEYRRQFRPSKYLSEPKNMVAVFAICGETEEEAERIASSLDLTLLMLERGTPLNGTLSPEKAAQYSYDSLERKIVQENRKRMIIGDPKQIHDQLLRLSELYETEEIVLVSITYSFEDRLRSYELIAEEVLK